MNKTAGYNEQQTTNMDCFARSYLDRGAWLERDADSHSLGLNLSDQLVNLVRRFHVKCEPGGNSDIP